MLSSAEILNRVEYLSLINTRTGISSKRITLLHALAWASQNNVPYGDVLEAFSKEPPSLIAWLKKTFGFNLWSSKLRRMSLDCRGGMPLYYALRRVGKYYPKYILLALERAELEDRLPETLPILAAEMDTGHQALKRISFMLYYPLIFIFCGSFIATALMVFIVPKFRHIYDELLEGAPLPRTFAILTWLSNQIFHHFLVINLLICLLILGIFFYAKVFWFRGIMQKLISRLPYLGPLLRRISLQELAGAMSTYLNAGDDLVTAADLSRAGTRHPWLQPKIQLFIGAVESGTDWVTAWCQMKIGLPLHDFIIRNYAALEQPAAGFRVLQQTVSREVDQKLNGLFMKMEVCFILILGLMTGLIVIGFGSTLWGMIHYCSQFY